jgi:hypothetical protein
MIEIMIFGWAGWDVFITPKRETLPDGSQSTVFIWCLSSIGQDAYKLLLCT